MFKYKIEDLHKGYEKTFTCTINESFLGGSCGREHKSEDEAPAY